MPSVPQLVRDLMDLETRSWQIQPIRDFIDWRTARAILASPIGRSHSTDKSGYHCLHSVNRSIISGNRYSSVSIPDMVWKSLWKVRTLPKIRHFLWRIVVNALPTKLNLFRRKIVPNPLCPFCENFITWEIWKSRCTAVFEGGVPEPIGVLMRADRAAKEFLEANIPPLPQHLSSLTLGSDSRWIPPLQGSVKVNIDGSWKTDSLRAGLGVVIRNSDGLFCMGLARPYRCSSALHAEAAAAIEGLQLAAQHGYEDIVLETDSKALVEGVHGSSKNQAWSILPLLDDIRCLCHNFQAVRWKWVSRNANRAAHMAATIGYGAVELESWANRPPQSLVHVLVSDGLPCPPGNLV
ncbi:unnamed protein product [Prunus brigantina]